MSGKLITCPRCLAMLRDYVVCPYCNKLLDESDSKNHKINLKIHK